MRKTLILLVVLMMVFAITIPASAGGNGPAGGVGPGDGTGPVGGLGPNGGICPDGNGQEGGIGPGDGTGPVGGLGPIGGNGNGGNGNGGNGNGGKGPANNQSQQVQRVNFTINGEIIAIGTDTITITMACGNKTARVYIGSQVTVSVTSLTRYNSEVGMVDNPINFSDLEAGQLVSLNGTVVNSVWIVRRITVVATLDCLQ